MGKTIKQLFGYSWRLFATAFSFFCFGVGGFVLWILIFPVLSLFSKNRATRRQRAQFCVHYSFYFFIGLMHQLGIMTYEVKGLEKLNRPGQLIIANHPTLIDIVFLISRMPQASCIVKQQLWDNPFTKGPVINAGYISNGDSSSMINQCVDYLKESGMMIVFPEGTRSVVGYMHKFQRGAARIALQSAAIVTPVTLSCYPHALTKAQKWYQIPAQPFHLLMQVGDDIKLDDFLEIEPKTIAVRRLNHCFQDYFNKEYQKSE